MHCRGGRWGWRAGRRQGWTRAESGSDGLVAESTEAAIPADLSFLSRGSRRSWRGQDPRQEVP
jgi:hypothetical protein